ncbi:MAG: choice-of-anchor H family protein [Granulosicoccus sp.]
MRETDMTRPHHFVLTTALALAASLFALPGGSAAAEAPAATTSSNLIGFHSDDRAWINDVGALLSADVDGDGYFSALSLSIDADSSYSQYEVYLIIDIADEFNQVEPFHTTRRFDVFGRSFSDEYRIDIDLVQNYPPGIYDLSVLLVDAHDNRVLDQVSANDFRNLRGLPLESEDNQSIHIPVSNRPATAPNDDIQVSEHAGSTGFGIILLLVVSALTRQGRRKKVARR